MSIHFVESFLYLEVLYITKHLYEGNVMSSTCSLKETYTIKLFL